MARQPGEVVMSMWVIYDNPTDYPGMYVARMWNVVTGELEPQPTAEIIITANVDDLSDYFLEQGLAFLARAEADDPKIMGVWL